MEFVERKRDWHGRFGAYLYRVVHIAAATSRKAAEVSYRKGRRRNKHPTTGHAGPMAPIKGLTKPHEDTPLPPKNDPKEGYWFLFGEKPPPGAEQKYLEEVQHRREEEARRRREGYDWFFE